ncbi:AMP-binding protein [Polaromonas sp. P1(28)-13]|nr:AMP-binding protein [Polaromonas sp. P1(28)-13]
MYANFTSDQWIALHARRQPEKIALNDEQRSISYGRLHQLIGQQAAALAAIGVRGGTTVGLLGSPTLQWVVAYLAVTRAGAVPVGLNYRETPQCIADQVRSAQAEFVLHDQGRAAHVADLAVTSLTLEHVLESPATSGNMVQRPQDGSDIGVLLYTGGSTGSSKGVELTHENLLWNVLNEIGAGDLESGDNALLATALHHSAALNTWLLPHLYLGATATLMGDFEPRRWIEMMQHFGATNTFTPPTMIRQILDAAQSGDDWSRFRKWFSGAGLLSRSDREEMKILCPGVRVYYQYGLTEAGPIVTCQRPEDYELNPLSMGRVVRHCEVRVVTEDGNLAAEGVVGELLVRSPAVMRGYFQQPEATAKVLKDGWLYTGDLVTQDQHGCLTFQDRAKDMIKTGGLNVFSQEVEAVLVTHPAVSEVAVIGLPDEKWGERVVAVISLKIDAQVSKTDIVEYGRTKLASYQLPKEVIFKPVSELPKNYLGKTLKRELRVQLQAKVPA